MSKKINPTQEELNEFAEDIAIAATGINELNEDIEKIIAALWKHHHYMTRRDFLDYIT